MYKPYSIEKLKNICSIARSMSFEIWRKHRKGALSGGFSTIELYSVLFFGLDKNIQRKISYVIPKPTSALSWYSILSLANIISYSDLDKYGTSLLPDTIHKGKASTITNFSLGQSLMQSTGIAHAIRLSKNKKKNKIILFMGDGEIQEGFTETLNYAVSTDLTNLVIVIDLNKLQSGMPVEGISRLHKPGKNQN